MICQCADNLVHEAYSEYDPQRQKSLQEICCQFQNTYSCCCKYSSSQKLCEDKHDLAQYRG